MDKRQAERYGVDIGTCTMHWVDNEYYCSLEDLSDLGMKIDVLMGEENGLPPLGATVTFSEFSFNIEELLSSATGTIAWIRELSLGIQFDSPIKGMAEDISKKAEE
ncbi:MAG: PilZ domain-containing protein [Desulfovibrio sp.]|uniref:PilZ domain-containing protein n=1 Tax=Desulfovibrio sp. 7SRBS1 TaxID=3378064 RepID=UPI003B40470B